MGLGSSRDSGGDSSGDNNSGNGVDIGTILALVAAASSLLMAVITGIFNYFRDKRIQQDLMAAERRFEMFKKELEDRQRRLVRFENVQELMKQYKKPLLQSAFDLQSRVSNQIKQSFVHVFIKQRDSQRDSNYARYNFAFVIAEFLGWLEVIRQEIVFITGQQDSNLLSALVDAIKFQFTGETPVQGVPPKGKENEPDYDQNSTLLQLYAGELRAIGEVMIDRRKADADALQLSANLNVIGFAEFMRRMSKLPPKPDVPEEFQEQWDQCIEKHTQETLAPLMEHIEKLSQLGKGEAPTRRLVILQVLLNKLIDMLDNAVPWDCGPKYDLENNEEPQYIPRDFRMTPLVSLLTVDQRKWLASQPFMEDSDSLVDDPVWHERIKEADPSFRKLCFCGFREDLSKLSQFEREQKPDMWVGACPPRCPRRRPQSWYNQFNPEEAMRLQNEVAWKRWSIWGQHNQMAPNKGMEDPKAAVGATTSHQMPSADGLRMRTIGGPMNSNKIAPEPSAVSMAPMQSEKSRAKVTLPPVAPVDSAYGSHSGSGSRSMISEDNSPMIATTQLATSETLRGRNLITPPTTLSVTPTPPEGPRPPSAGSVRSPVGQLNSST